MVQLCVFGPCTSTRSRADVQEPNTQQLWQLKVQFILNCASSDQMTSLQTAVHPERYGATRRGRRGQKAHGLLWKGGESQNISARNYRSSGLQRESLR
jgi:hypothetical protein